MVTHVAVTDHQSWDGFVASHGGGFLQSWDWSLFQEKLGRIAYRYRVAADAPAQGELAQFLMLELPLPFGQKYGYLPRGPVLACDPGDGKALLPHLDAVVAALREIAVRDRLTFVRIEWPWPSGAAGLTAQDLRSRGFVPAPPMQPAHTSVVQLGRSEEELLGAMHPKTRYNVRVAERHGVVVRQGSGDADFEAFWSLLAETAKRDNFHTHARDYYAKMFAQLAGTPPADGPERDLRVRLWLAEREGRAIAAALTAEFGDTVTYLHGASRSGDRKYMAPYLLHWRIIADAKARGFARYDFWGTAPNDDETHPWAGITRFKKGFGGSDEAYLGAWELPVRPRWYSAYRFAKRIRGAH